jgi:hypothetical protein
MRTLISYKVLNMIATHQKKKKISPTVTARALGCFSKIRGIPIDSTHFTHVSFTMSVFHCAGQSWSWQLLVQSRTVQKKFCCEYSQATVELIRFHAGAALAGGFKQLL